MRQCKAKNKRGGPCRLPARPGSDFCDTLGHDPGAATLPPNADAPPSPPSPARGESSAAPGETADPWDLLRAFEAAPPPDQEAAAAAPEADQLPPPPPPGGAADPEPDAWMRDVSPGEVGGGDDPWTPEAAGELVNPIVDGLFEATGKRPQNGRELTHTGKAFAKMFNAWFRAVDPNSPWGALAVWSLAVPLPRYAGGIFGGAPDDQTLRVVQEEEPPAPAARRGGMAGGSW